MAGHRARTETGNEPQNQQEEIRKVALLSPTHSMKIHIPSVGKNLEQQPPVLVSFGGWQGRKKKSKTTCISASPVCHHSWKAEWLPSPQGCSSFPCNMTVRAQTHVISRVIQSTPSTSNCSINKSMLIQESNREWYLVTETQQCSST